MNRQERAEATRWQILHAAASAFEEAGFNGANINDIVARANVTKGALYFHFESKEILARALIDERTRRLEEAVKPIGGTRIPALEKLIHGSITVAMLALTDEIFRAGDQLLLEIGDFAGACDKPVLQAADKVAQLLGAAIAEHDVVDIDPESIGRLMVLQFMGARVLLRAVDQKYDLLVYLEALWQQLIQTYVSEPVRPYFTQLVARMMVAQRVDDRVESGLDVAAVPS